MKISIITLFPDMITGFFNESIIKKAQEKGLVTIELINLRDFALDSYGTVDDRPYGGGAGMVLRIEPIQKALETITNDPPSSRSESGLRRTSKQKIVMTSARGQVYSQKKAQEYSQLEHLVILAGHYEGIDERISEYIDEEVSVGDFVLTGGEIVASAIVDSVVRLLPGVLKKEEATTQESFFEVSVDELIKVCGADNHLEKLQAKGVKTVSLLEYPHYTRPAEFDRLKVPEVLLQGNHKEIEQWRLKEAYTTTLQRRPDLLDKC